jgi:hypothetical protein
MMAKAIALEEGVLRPRLLVELESFRAPDRRLSSYYLNLNPPAGATAKQSASV